MHEAAITEALLEQVRTHAPGAARVRAVRVEVGALEHLDAEVMGTIWRAMTEDSPLSGARLEITPEPVRVRCRACGREFEPEDRAILLCPECGRASPQILSGSGVILRSIELEQEG